MFRFDYLHYRPVPDFNYTAVDFERTALLAHCQPSPDATPLAPVDSSNQDLANATPLPHIVTIRPVSAPNRVIARRLVSGALDVLPRVAFTSAALLASVSIKEYRDISVEQEIAAAVSTSGLDQIDSEVATSLAASEGVVDPVQLKMILDKPSAKATVEDFESQAYDIVQNAGDHAKRSMANGLKAVASLAVGSAGLLLNRRRQQKYAARTEMLSIDSETQTFVLPDLELPELPLHKRFHLTPFPGNHITGVDSRDKFSVHEVRTGRQTRSVQRGLGLAALAAATLTMVPKLLNSQPVDSLSSRIDTTADRAIPTRKIDATIPSFISDQLKDRVTGPIIPVITAELPNITSALNDVDRSLVSYIEEQTEESGIDTDAKQKVSLSSGIFGPTLDGVSTTIEHIGFDPTSDDPFSPDIALPLVIVAAAGAYGLRKRPERFLVTERVLAKTLPRKP